jgi:oxygen-independent coproporphyrinogen-3 oxidase
MGTDDALHTIRANLFYGLLNYTKSFPDFSIPQRFEMVSPRRGKALLGELNQSLMGEEKLLIYVHLPFCSSECVFCNAFPQKSNEDIQKRYLEGLLEEIRIYQSADVFGDRRVECLYLGGGTPTSFATDEIRRVILALKSAAHFSESCSITCEAHTKDILDSTRIQDLARAGVNRISIGCQTFADREADPRRTDPRIVDEYRHDDGPSRADPGGLAKRPGDSGRDCAGLD